MSGLRSIRKTTKQAKKITSLLLASVLVLPAFGSFAHADAATAGEFTFESTYYSIGEADGSVMLTVNRMGGLEGEVTVDYTTLDGSAYGDNDYGSNYGTLIFADGESSKTIYIGIYDDYETEGDESFSAELSNPTGGATISPYSYADVTIVDDDYWIPDPPGEFNLDAASYSVGEGDGYMTLIVNRTNGAGGEVTVDYGIGGGSASEGSDFGGMGGTLVFAEGETLKTIEVPIYDDSDYEGDENFSVSLFNATGGASIGSLSSANVTIADNDSSLGEFTLESGTYSITENGYRLKLNVLRENGSDSYATVDYATAGGTAAGGSDYLETSSQLIFNPGDTSATIEIEVIDDKAYEGSETFTVSLSNPTGNTKLGSITSAVVTILDNDPSSQVQFNTSTYYGIEESGSVTVKVTRTGSTDEAATVQYASVSGTAKAGTDFTSASGTLTFAKGEISKTIKIRLLDDTLKELNESFSVKLLNPTGGIVLGAQASAVVSILDMDHINLTVR